MVQHRNLAYRDNLTSALRISGNGSNVMVLEESKETGTTYNLVIDDAEKFIIFNNASAITVNLSPDSTTNFPIGTEILITKHGAGSPTITRGAGVALYGTAGGGTDADFSLSNKYALARIKKLAANTWQVNHQN